MFDESQHPRNENGQFKEKEKYKSNISSQEYFKRDNLRKEYKLEMSKRYGLYKNEQSGISAKFNGKSIKKIISDKAIDKSNANGFSTEQHFEVASKITSLFESATLYSTRKPKEDNNSNLISIKRFISQCKLKDGMSVNAYITVKETLQNGHKIYSVELFDIKKTDFEKSLPCARNNNCLPTSIQTLHQIIKKINNQNKHGGKTMRIVFRKSWLLGKDYLKKSENEDDPKFNYFKKLVMKHLSELEEKHSKEKAEIKKSILEAESMQKAGYPVGTIREWKGKKYIKIAQGKWRPKYDSHTRGAKLSIAALKRQADKCTSSEQLIDLVLENRDRFSDKLGRPLPFVKELSDYVSEKNDKLESEKAKKASKKKPAEKKKTESEKIERVSQDVIDKVTKECDKTSLSYADMLKKPVATIQKYANTRVEDFDGGIDDFIDFMKEKNPNVTVQEVGKEFARLINHNIARKIFDVYNKKGYVIDEKGYFKTAEEEENQEKETESKEKAEEERWFDSEYKLTKEEAKEDSLEELKERLTYTEERLEDAKFGAEREFSKEDNILSFDTEETKKEKERAFEENKRNAKLQVAKYKGWKQALTELIAEKQKGLSDKKSSGIEKIREKYESSKSVTGNKKTVTTPNGEKIKCHYKIVEADAPTASHNEITYGKTEGFPTTADGKSVNDRDYQNDQDAQMSVIKIAQNFNSLALDSPPIVTKDGIVISGNNRTMSSKLAARNGTDKQYLEDFKEMADEYGFEAEDLDKFKNPRLILEVDEEHKGDYTVDEFAKFNKDTKKTMNNVEKAVKLTKTLNAEKIQSIAEVLQGYETMGELYADTKGSQDFVLKLVQAGIIGDNEKAQYCRTDGSLNDTGKDFVETVLVGSVLNENNIRKLDGLGGRKIRQKLVRAILPLIENKGTGKEYSFNTELNDAVEIAVNVAKDHETYPTVKTYLAQGSLFGEKKPDAVTSKLAEIIHDEGEKAFAQRMKDLNAGLRQSADGIQDIFLGGVESKESLMDRFLGIKKSIADILTKFVNKERTVSEMVADVLGKIA